MTGAEEACRQPPPHPLKCVSKDGGDATPARLVPSCLALPPLEHTHFLLQPHGGLSCALTPRVFCHSGRISPARTAPLCGKTALLDRLPSWAWAESGRPQEAQCFTALPPPLHRVWHRASAQHISAELRTVLEAPLCRLSPSNRADVNPSSSQQTGQTPGRTSHPELKAAKERQQHRSGGTSGGR